MDMLNNITSWQTSFGLLPIKLFSGSGNEGNFILLDGGAGDFCLQLVGDERDNDYYFSSAWSSNTKNYVAIKGDKVDLYNWKNKSVETIKQSTVNQHYSKFYNYILKNSGTSQSDVVPFIINIFRKIRNLTNDKKEATESLNLLFLLLASYEENNDFNSIDLSKWNINLNNKPNDEFEKYIKEFSNGLAGKRPLIDLIIRHASGQLFQEAQREALLFDKTLDLFSGTLSSAYNTRKLLYSSIHYTPSYLSRAIVENSLNKIDIFSRDELKILDPSCGSAEFLMEVLKQLKSKGYNNKVNIIGWDTSASAISTANFLLTYEKREWGDKLSIDVKLVEDSLTQNWDNDYDMVLMNPPFVSWELMPKDAQGAVRDSLDTVFDGKPNQASAFFYKAVQSLKEGGIIGSVVPTSLFSLDAYKKLRKNVLDTISLSLVGKLGNFVFEDALTDISIVVGHKPITQELPVLIWSRNEKGVVLDVLKNLRKMQYDNAPLSVSKDYSIYTPSYFPIISDNWKPISYAENILYGLVERLVVSGKLIRVHDLFNVQQGVRSGNNNIFKISASQFIGLSPEEQTYFRPAIDNDSIKNGRLMRRTYLWYPYDINGFAIADEEQLKIKAPWFYSNKLVQHEPVLKARKHMSTNANWWDLSRPRTWQYERKTKLCSTEFGKSDSFALDLVGDFIIERGQGWVPKKKLTIEDQYFYLAIFSSSIFNDLLSIYSKQLLSGWDLGKQYTRNIPIPNVFLPEIRESFGYEKIVSFGRSISENNAYSIHSINELVTEQFYSA